MLAPNRISLLAQQTRSVHVVSSRVCSSTNASKTLFHTADVVRCVQYFASVAARKGTLLHDGDVMCYVSIPFNTARDGQARNQRTTPPMRPTPAGVPVKTSAKERSLAIRRPSFPATSPAALISLEPCLRGNFNQLPATLRAQIVAETGSEGRINILHPVRPSDTVVVTLNSNSYHENGCQRSGAFLLWKLN